MFCTSTSFKKNLVLDVIPDANLKINSQRMATIIVAINANNSKIQQSHAKFLWTFGQQQKGGDKMKRIPKKCWIGYNLKDNFNISMKTSFKNFTPC
jgi:hypothetical protein